MEPTLLPTPKSLTISPGEFRLQGVVEVSAPGFGSLSTNLISNLERLTATVLVKQPLPSGPAHIEIDCLDTGKDLPTFGDNESYELEISAQGIRISAHRRTGIYYGLQTLLQLARPDGDGVVFPCCTISDEPRFKWRGLMLDVARHFMPLELVKRMVDGMGRAKLNVLHLGLSNNQGFRVESKNFPRLHTIASNGEYYTQDEIANLITFAAERGVRLVPEFNMPGHSTCFTLAYQELATGKPRTELRKTSGVFDDEMNPASAHMDRFLEDFIGEMAALFPDPYWHFGGDEVTGKAWDADEGVQAFMKARDLADNRALQAHFTARVLKELKKHGKKAIGWEEVAEGAPPKDTVIQPWMTPASNKIFDGYPLIVSTSYYLDHFLRAEDYYAIDPEPEDPRRNVIGAEACVWTEVMNPDNVEAIIWPGALALAARFWSPQGTSDVPSPWLRIMAAQDRMERLGCADLDAPKRLAERLCGGNIPPSVALLRDYTAPLVYYFVMNRAEAPHDVTAPFSRLIETLLPETDAMHRFEALVDAALAGDRTPLIVELKRLVGLRDAFRSETARLPSLQENQPLADALSEIAKSCLEVLEGRPATHDLPLNALMPPRTNDLTGVLEAVSRRRKADLRVLLQETNIAILPALRRVLESADPGATPC